MINVWIYFVDKGNKDTTAYDLKVSAGGVLIFNELGFHRAASPSKNDRYALRYFYRRFDYPSNSTRKIS